VPSPAAMAVFRGCTCWCSQSMSLGRAIPWSSGCSTLAPGLVSHSQAQWRHESGNGNLFEAGNSSKSNRRGHNNPVRSNFEYFEGMQPSSLLVPSTAISCDINADLDPVTMLKSVLKLVNLMVCEEVQNSFEECAERASHNLTLTMNKLQQTFDGTLRIAVLIHPRQGAPLLVTVEELEELSHFRDILHTVTSNLFVML
jgi:hypothetical protein